MEVKGFATSTHPKGGPMILMELGHYSWAAAALDGGCVVTRRKLDENGNRAWRRKVFRRIDGIYQQWESGHIDPFTPTQEDLMATDWEIAPCPKPE